MKKLLLLILIGVQSAFGQSIVGTWNGEAFIQGQTMPIVFKIEAAGDSLSGSMSLPTQNNVSGPVSSVRLAEGNDLTITIASLRMTYKGVLKVNEVIEGQITQAGMNIPLNLRRGEYIRNRPQTPVAPYNYHTEDVDFKNETEGSKLVGTIAAPTNSKDHPIYVMITGSGPQNRDSELFFHKPFLVIADYLAKKGIATLRLDDRGVGKSDLGKLNPTSVDFAGDINSAVNYLVRRGYKNIGLIGHSEGGMIAPMVATQNENVSSIVVMAGPGEPIKKMFPAQMYNLTKAMGISGNSAKEMSKRLSVVLEDFTKREAPFSKEEISEILTPVYQGMDKSTAQIIINEVSGLFMTAWGHYFLSYDPHVYNSKLVIPVLAINGSLDMNVPARENLEGIRMSLEKAGNKNFEIVEFEGLNHVFQTAITGAPAEIATIEETIAPQVLEKMGDWILKLKK